jgi:long-chain acyl-CoA synthetase
VVVPDFEALKRREVVNSYDAIRYEMESLSERLPGYRRVLSLEIRQEPLPRTTTRKIKRFEVQREVLEHGAKRVAEPVGAPPETPIEERLFAMIRALKDAPAINRSMNLELDLGLTSLERVELFSAIQGAFGARILEEEAAKIHTVGELLEAVERLGGGAADGAGEALISWGSILRAPLDAEEERIAEGIMRSRPVFELLRHALSKLVRLAAGLLLRFRFEGIENLPQPPFLICPNHNSYLDAFLIMGALPFGVSRRMFFLGEAMYFEGPVMGKVARWLKVVAVSPDRAVRFSLRLAAEGLGRGLVLCVFPEGERSIDGRLKAFRKGPSIVATEMGLPVVPAGVRGTWEVWRRGSNHLQLHPVAVVFGEALSAGGKSADEFNAELREAVQRLL